MPDTRVPLDRAFPVRRSPPASPALSTRPATASDGMQRRRRPSGPDTAGRCANGDGEAAKPGSPRWGPRLRRVARGHPLLAVAAAAALTAGGAVGAWAAWRAAAAGAAGQPASSSFFWGGRRGAAGGGWPAVALWSALPAGVPLPGFPDVLAHRLLSAAAVAARHPPLPDEADAVAVGAPSSPPRKKKIVGLVEARNALRALPFFLSALSLVVDSVVLLDDVSSDASVAFLAAHGGRLGVEAVLTKAGGWVREELRDRSILLAAGRRVGGTHFVLLDYDEVFAHGCAADGSLRRRIAALRPGRWLALPWVEAWRSAGVARVRPDDPDMNFLTRRQVVVFADDGAVSYGVASSLSRQLSASATGPAGGGSGGGAGGGGDGARPATIHSLRCPRSLCPPPPAYHAPPPSARQGAAPAAPDSRCGVVELRFLNLENVLLKAAWYEALAVRHNASAAVSRGKMIDALFGGGAGGGSGSSSGGVATRPVAAASVAAYPLWAPSVYDVVDSWRAREVVAWTARLPAAALDAFPALSRVDVVALRAALEAPTVDLAAEGDAVLAAASAAAEAFGAVAAGAGGVATANAGGRRSTPPPPTLAMPPGLLHYVPRRRRPGEPQPPTLVVLAAALPAVRAYAGRLLHAMGGSPVVLPSPAAASLKACGAGGVPDEASYEARRSAVEPALRASGVRPAGGGGPPSLTYVAPPVGRLACELSDVLARELADVHVVYLVLSTGGEDGAGGGVGAFATPVDLPVDVDSLSVEERVAVMAALSRDRWAPAAASVGSPHTLLTVHADALLSLVGAAALATAMWPTDASAATPVDWQAVLGVVEAENRHQRRGRAARVSASAPPPSLPPVARLLFSLNCGRSGSRYLAGLLGTVGGVRVALHEPPCPAGACSGGGGMPMQRVRLVDSYASRRDVKLPMIRAALAGAVSAALAPWGGGVAERTPGAAATAVPTTGGCGGGDQPHLFSLSVVGVGARHAGGAGDAGGGPAAVAGRGGVCLVWQPALYAETNPNFKAWFWDVVLDGLAGDGGYDVDVLHVRKYLPAVVKSLYETGYFTSRDGTTWMETGNGVNALVRAPPPAASAGAAPADDDGRRQAAALDALLSYVINAEAVGRAVAARYARTRGVRFTDARAEVLYTAPGATALVRRLGLTPTAATAAVAGVRVDKYGAGGGRKRKRSALPLAVAAAATDRYLARCAAAGIAVPQGMGHLRRVDGFAYPE